jgi:2-dehydropantoate 2-reductase
MNILNIACGAVGAYCSGRLAENGAKVAVTIRSSFEEIKAKGFEITSIAGNFKFMPDEVLTSSKEYKNDADYIFITSKVLPNANTVALLDGVVKENTVIVLIQNGLSIEDKIAKAYPNNEILSCVAYLGINRTTGNKIIHQGGGQLRIGKFGGGPSLAAQKLCDAFNAAKIEAIYTCDIAFERWQKLLWNITFNAISVAGGGLKTSEICDNGLLEDLGRSLMEEIIKVANSVKVALSFDMIEEMITFTRNFPPYKTSMLIDFECKRPLEIEAIVGEVVRLGKANNIPVPHLETIYALLTSLDKLNVKNI